MQGSLVGIFDLRFHYRQKARKNHVPKNRAPNRIETSAVATFKYRLRHLAASFASRLFSLVRWRTCATYQSFRCVCSRIVLLRYRVSYAHGEPLHNLYSLPVADALVARAVWAFGGWLAAPGDQSPTARESLKNFALCHQ